MIKPKVGIQYLNFHWPTVRLNVLSVQGAGKMTKSRKLEEGAKKVEGSGVVQNQIEIQASNMVSMVCLNSLHSLFV